MAHWRRLCRGWRNRLLILIVLTVLLFIVSTFVRVTINHEPVMEVSLETFNQLANKDEFFRHVEDMQRLRKSIIIELGQLEGHRNRLRTTVEALSKNLKESESQLKSLERSLIQSKSNIASSKLIEAETFKKYLAVSLPLEQSLTSSHANYTNLRDKKECRLQSCFDYSRCSVVAGFPVYLYPITTDENVLLLWKSAIVKSQYVTDNADIACIYLFLHAGGSFEPRDLRYWRGDGRNHVIINVFSNDFVLPKSRAMQAQIKFNEHDPIGGFDIVLPHMNLQPLDCSKLPLMLPVRRPNLVSFFGRAPSVAHEQEKNFVTALSHLHAPQLSVTIDVNCVGVTCAKDQWCPCSEGEYIEAERNSTFVIVLNSVSMPSEQFASRIYTAFENGIVPVILGDQYQLPLEELIPWHEVAVLLPSQRVTELVYILRNILEPDIIAFKKRGRLIFENILLSIPKIADGLIDILRIRINIPPVAAPIPESIHIYSDINPMPMFETRIEPNEVLGPVEEPFPSPSYQRNFTYWHGNSADSPQAAARCLYPHTPWDPILPTDAKYHGSPYGFRPINGGAGGSGKEFSQSLGGNNPREQFTIVILTYDRPELLQQQLAQFNGLPYLNKVLVIWNNPNYPHATLQWPHIHVPLQVIKASKNSLNNRFLPYKEIETEAVLSLDDDMYLRHDEIIFAFRVWREYRDRVVGFPGRYHAWNDRDQLWNYNSNHSCELSLVLTGAAFLHKYYLYQYSYFMPQAIRDKVDDFMNCEDIAMNFLVSHMTGKPPVKTTSRWTFRCPTCGEASLWTDESHFNERHQCIQYFIQVYGYLPLLYTQLRTDSVLFKTRVPQDKSKCFSLV